MTYISTFDSSLVSLRFSLVLSSLIFADPSWGQWLMSRKGSARHALTLAFAGARIDFSLFVLLLGLYCTLASTALSSVPRRYLPGMIDSIVYIPACVVHVYILENFSSYSYDSRWSCRGAEIGSLGMLMLYATVLWTPYSMELCPGSLMTAQWTLIGQVD